MNPLAMLQGKSKQTPALRAIPDLNGNRRRRMTAVISPLIAVGVVVAVWEIIYLSGWRPSYVLPPPLTVGQRLIQMVSEGRFWAGVSTTLLRAVIGFGLAVVVGTFFGLAVVSQRTFRAAVRSLITGMQTMPSIAWFPFAILLFGLSEQAILFVVLLGAAPSVANGLISGVDEIPVALIRNARSMGASGFRLYLFIVIPAALPTYCSGLKQGWAFAWRSLMAGELLVIIASRPSLGVSLQYFREFSDTSGLMAVMIVILIIGMGADKALSLIIERLQRRRGLGGGIMDDAR